MRRNAEEEQGIAAEHRPDEAWLGTAKAHAQIVEVAIAPKIRHDPGTITPMPGQE